MYQGMISSVLFFCRLMGVFVKVFPSVTKEWLGEGDACLLFVCLESRGNNFSLIFEVS